MNPNPTPPPGYVPLEVVAPDHSVRGHHRYGMSKLNSIDPSVGGCRGYIGRSGTSAAAEEGTALHERMEALLKDYLQVSAKLAERLLFSDFVLHRRDWDDEVHPLIVFAAEDIGKQLVPGAQVYIEIKVHIRRDNGSEVNYGHLDLLIVVGRKGILSDYKFGHIPVTPAKKNRQGIGYAAGVFARFPDLDEIEVRFIQPRLRWVSSAKFPRVEAGNMTYGITKLVEAAEHTRLVVEDPKVAADQKVALLNPGSACQYCSEPANCPGYLQKFGAAVKKWGGIGEPVHINVDAIDTPEKAAVVKAWIDFVELAADEVKKKCFAIAENNGNEIRCELPDGQVIQYAVQTRKIPRKLGNAVEIAEAMKEYVRPEQLLAAADLSLGKFVEVSVPAYMDYNPNIGSKRAAEETLIGMLEGMGLITQPDGVTKFLKAVKSKKQIA